MLPAARRRWGAPFWPPRAAAAELAWELGWTCVPARQPKGPAHARLSPGRSPPRDTGAMPQLCRAPWHPLTATPSRRGLETALLSAPVFPRLPPLGRPSPQAPSEPSARIPVPFRWRRTGAGFQPSAAPFASSRSRMALTQLVPRGRAPGPPSQPPPSPPEPLPGVPAERSGPSSSRGPCCPESRPAELRRAPGAAHGPRLAGWRWHRPRSSAGKAAEAPGAGPRGLPCPAGSPSLLRCSGLGVPARGWPHGPGAQLCCPLRLAPAEHVRAGPAPLAPPGREALVGV